MGTTRRTSKKAEVVKLKRELDSTDLKVLDLLQKEGRLANKDLARMVQLSPTPCLRRVSQLKAAGYIRGYRAILDPAMLGFTLRAFLTLKRSRDSDREKLTEQILVIPEVQSCHVVSGEYDFLVELLARDMDDYARIAIGHISELPGIYDLRSTFSIVPLRTVGELPILKRPPQRKPVGQRLLKQQAEALDHQHEAENTEENLLDFVEPREDAPEAP